MGKQKLDVRADGATEVLRIYGVTLERPDLTDDDGTPIVYESTVALRFSHDEAEMLDPLSNEAFGEAERRACKVERRDYGLDLSVPLYVVDGKTRLVSTRLVAARVGKGN